MYNDTLDNILVSSLAGWIVHESLCILVAKSLTPMSVVWWILLNFFTALSKHEMSTLTVSVTLHGKWTALTLCFLTLTYKVLYNWPVIHAFTHIYTTMMAEVTCKAQAWPTRINLRFSVLSKSTMCGTWRNQGSNRWPALPPIHICPYSESDCVL